MSRKFVAEFSPPPSPNPQHDLLARLYREIGLSAVAAALDIVNATPAPTPATTSAQEAGIPALLSDENMAA
jgi:hypothetical protein